MPINDVTPNRPSQFPMVGVGGGAGRVDPPNINLSGLGGAIRDITDPGWREKKALEFQKKQLSNETAAIEERQEKLDKLHQQHAKNMFEQAVALAQQSLPARQRMARAIAAGESGSRHLASSNVLNILSMQRSQGMQEEELADAVDEAQAKYFGDLARERQVVSQGLPLIYQAVTSLPQRMKADPVLNEALRSLGKYTSPLETPLTQPSARTGALPPDQPLGNPSNIGSYLLGKVGETLTPKGLGLRTGEEGEVPSIPTSSASDNYTDTVVGQSITEPPRFNFAPRMTREEAQKSVGAVIPTLLPPWVKQGKALDAMQVLLSGASDEEVLEATKNLSPSESRALVSHIHYATSLLDWMAGAEPNAAIDIAEQELSTDESKAALGKMMGGMKEAKQMLAEAFPDATERQNFQRSMAYLSDQLSRVGSAVAGTTDNSTGHTLEIMKRRWNAAALSGLEAARGSIAGQYEAVSLAQALGENDAKAYLNGVIAGGDSRSASQFMQDLEKHSPNLAMYAKKQAVEVFNTVARTYISDDPSAREALAHAGITTETIGSMVQDMPILNPHVTQDWARGVKRALDVYNQTGNPEGLKGYFNIEEGKDGAVQVTPLISSEEVSKEFGPTEGPQVLSSLTADIRAKFGQRTALPLQDLFEQAMTYEKAKAASTRMSPVLPDQKTSGQVGPPAPSSMDQRLNEAQKTLSQPPPATEVPPPDVNVGPAPEVSPQPSPIPDDPVKTTSRVYTPDRRNTDRMKANAEKYAQIKTDFQQGSVAPPPPTPTAAVQQRGGAKPPATASKPQGQSGPKLVQPNLNMAEAMQAPPVL